MKKIIFVLFLFTISHFAFSGKALALENPANSVNNKFGIHILFPEELKDASALVNSSGGDWGYVLIPIQSGDKDLVKWQKFMDNAKKYHLIPIVRLATEGDYFNTKVWRKPDFADVLDFANFLDSLSWPVKNRYVVVFNETNRSDEWGGEASPYEYANILNYAVQAFKSRSSDFFIISGGLDNAAPNVPGKFYNEYQFMREMELSVNGIFTQIDGLGSHSYPNPGFSQPPSAQSNQGAGSFKYEKDLAIRLGAKTDLPVFITETGWSRSAVPENLISTYYKYAFENLWSQEDVVAVVPFLLKAGAPPFDVFSFLNADGTKNITYKTIESMQKKAGAPVLIKNASSVATLGEKTDLLNEKKFSDKVNQNKSFSLSANLKIAIKWLLKI
ncbi:hypothetical protein C4559_03000 [Candidatus Microgenomates bacterium]|nr:MAG: hypothetical protein C4559_03000 [Candidatus Microgenomates bacterium]